MQSLAYVPQSDSLLRSHRVSDLRGDAVPNLKRARFLRAVARNLLNVSALLRWVRVWSFFRRFTQWSLFDQLTPSRRWV